MRRHRRGLTVIELLLALSLAGIVSSAVMGMYFFLAAASTRGDERFEETLDNAITYQVLLRTMQTLVAANPLPEDPTGQASAGGEERGADVRGGGGGIEGPVNAFEARVAADQPVMFDLAWVDVGDGIVVQRLELVTLEAPFPLRLLTDEEVGRRVTESERARWEKPDKVRGVIEFDQEASGSWNLVWRPTDPPGRPFVLLRDLVAGEWSVLEQTNLSHAESRGASTWNDVAAAFLGEDFPVAVRLVARDAEGRTLDWLFETEVITRMY